MTHPKVVKCRLAILVLSFALIVCVTPVRAITGGEPDYDGHPNVGAVILKSDHFNAFVFCSGTLIADKVFLTSGYCTYYLKSLLMETPARDSGIKVFVSFSSEEALEEGWLTVAEIITHSDYNNGSASNPRDVGALILEESVTGITPAILPSLGFLDDLRMEGKLNRGRNKAEFTVVGYGATLEWPPPRIGRPDGVRRVSMSQYLNLRKVWLLMSQNQAPGREDGGTCYGDFGAPVFWVEDGTEILVAISFWGDAQRVATGTSYRVDISDTLDFIQDAIDGAMKDGLPSPRATNRLAATWQQVKSGH